MAKLKKAPIPDENPWRVFRIMAEFVEGFDELSQIGPAVSIFGSSRIKPDHKYYKAAEKTAELLVKEGYAVITGGGPSIMEAGNKGAAGARGHGEPAGPARHPAGGTRGGDAAGRRHGGHAQHPLAAAASPRRGGPRWPPGRAHPPRCDAPAGLAHRARDRSRSLGG